MRRLWLFFWKSNLLCCSPSAAVNKLEEPPYKTKQNETGEAGIPFDGRAVEMVLSNIRGWRRDFWEREKWRHVEMNNKSKGFQAEIPTFGVSQVWNARTQPSAELAQARYAYWIPNICFVIAYTSMRKNDSCNKRIRQNKPECISVTTALFQRSPPDAKDGWARPTPCWQGVQLHAANDSE